MGQDGSRAAANGQPGAASRGSGGGGASTSKASAAAAAVPTVVALAGIEGFQVVRLLPYSPAHKTGLVPFFDIITALDHVLLDAEGKPALQFFKSYVTNHRDQPVCFTVFNLHTRAYRDVSCIPSDEWGGGGLLGCSIEWARAEACPERCVHVVDVLEGSPAEHCRELKANRDYIVGMQTAQEPLITLIKNQSDFYSRLEAWHEEQRWALERKQRFPSEAVEVPHVLLFLVYNSENNSVKEVAIEMGTNPEAALGMSVATGLLHIIPSAATSPDLATGASLPVMNRFVALGPGPAPPSPAQAPPAPAAEPPHPPGHHHNGSPRTVAADGVHELPMGFVTGWTASSTAPVHATPLDSYQQPFPTREPPAPRDGGAPGHGEMAENYVMPPATPYDVVPPPREATVQASSAVPRPPPPQQYEAPPHKQHTLHNPFAGETSPAEAIFDGPSPPPHPTYMTHAPPQGPPPHEGVNHAGQPAAHAEPTAQAVAPPSSSPAVKSVTHAAGMNGAAAPSTHGGAPPPPQQAAMPFFSAKQMPPPLHYPVFPGAAARRAPAA